MELLEVMFNDETFIGTVSLHGYNLRTPHSIRIIDARMNRIIYVNLLYMNVHH